MMSPAKAKTPKGKSPAKVSKQTFSKLYLYKIWSRDDRDEKPTKQFSSSDRTKLKKFVANYIIENLTEDELDYELDINTVMEMLEDGTPELENAYIVSLDEIISID